MKNYLKDLISDFNYQLCRLKLNLYSQLINIIHSKLELSVKDIPKLDNEFINNIKRIHAINKYDGITEKLYFNIITSIGETVQCYITLEYDDIDYYLTMKVGEKHGGGSRLPFANTDEEEIQYIVEELESIFKAFNYKLV